MKNYEGRKVQELAMFSSRLSFLLAMRDCKHESRNEKKSLADLETAGPVSENTLRCTRILAMSEKEISKRKVAVIELKGRYKEAAEKYMKMFNELSDQLHLNAPLTGDAASKAQASNWLDKLVEPSSFRSETEQCDFFLRKGKANLSLGNIAQAKTYLAKSCAVSVAQSRTYCARAIQFRRHDGVIEGQRSSKVTAGEDLL